MLELASSDAERRLAMEGVLRTERRMLWVLREEREDLERQNRNMEDALALIRAREAAKNPSGKSPDSN